MTTSNNTAHATLGQGEKSDKTTSLSSEEKTAKSQPEDLHQLAEHWERLHAETLKEFAADATRPAIRRLMDAANARRLIATAESRRHLDQKRASYDRLVASDLSDDEALGPRHADGREQLQREQLQQEMLRDHQAATRRAQRVMQQRENQYRYQPQEN